MSSVPEIEYCPYRTNIDWRNVQVADYSQVEYFQPSGSEEEEVEDEDDLEESGM
jgi:hypothetical protein